MLTTTQTTDLRATQQGALTRSCQIQRPTATSDGAGGQTTTTATVATVPCAYRQRDLSVGERELAGRLGVGTLLTLTVPWGTDLRNVDRVLVDGRTFEVQASPLRGSLQLAVQAVVAEVA